jgi:hypothetical protein
MLCVCPLVLSCGGGSSSENYLAILPASQTVTVNLEMLTIQSTPLQVSFNGTQIPIGSVAWTYSNRCVSVMTGGYVACGFTCGSTLAGGGTSFTATITGTAEGATGTASITCHYE